MINELDDCFQELQQTKADVTGKEEFVLIEGKKYPALIGVVTSAGVFVSGGEAESGGFSCQVRKALFSESADELQGLEIRQGADGRKLSIASAIERNGTIYEIIATDFSNEQG